MTYEQQLEQKIADQEKIIESLLNDIKTIATTCHFTFALAVTVINENGEKEQIADCMYAGDAIRDNNILVKKDVIPLDKLSEETRGIITELKSNNGHIKWQICGGLNSSKKLIYYATGSYGKSKFDKYRSYTKTRRK